MTDTADIEAGRGPGTAGGPGDETRGPGRGIGGKRGGGKGGGSGGGLARRGGGGGALNKPKRQRRKLRAMKLIGPEAGMVVSVPAPRARLRFRHVMLVLSFLAMVAAPLGFVGWYLADKAADQYHSVVAFTVRSEESSSAFDILGALTGSGGNSGTDAEILHEYIQSQQMVEKLDAALDLRAIYNRAGEDWLFRLGAHRSIEDLHWYWGWAVDVAFDNNSGLIEVTARAFDPEDAHRIAAAVLEESNRLVNRLSDEARADAIRFSEADLEEAEARLREMRVKLRTFRNENRIIDPEAGVTGFQGLVNTLEEQLAQALVARNELRSFASENDPRLANAERRIEAIREQIEAEKAALAARDTTRGQPLAEVIGAYEELLVDLKFSEDSYTSALAAFEAARAEARRQTRYLAAHVEPTMSEVPQYPQRVLLTVAAGLVLLVVWGVVVLLGYNVRDRR